MVLIAAFAQTGFAQKGTLDKETFIKAVRILEQDPFLKDAKKHRQTLTFYLIETKDVSVVLCSIEVTEPVFDKKYKFSNELFSQSMFGMAVFKLENPDKANDEAAAQLAGVESLLRTYEVMVAKNPKAKFAAVDDLIKARDEGTLAKRVSDAYAECSKK